MNKLNFLGIGPKIAVVLLPWLAASIFFSSIFKPLFAYTTEYSRILLYAGVVMMAAGLLFYGSTVRKLLAGLKETRLMTEGPYAMCQHPLYASLVVLIIPALSLILNSWLVLTSALVGYIMVTLLISKENTELEKFFGESYLNYKASTPLLFPVPPILRKSGR